MKQIIQPTYLTIPVIAPFTSKWIKHRIALNMDSKLCSKLQLKYVYMHHTNRNRFKPVQCRHFLSLQRSAWRLWDAGTEASIEWRQASKTFCWRSNSTRWRAGKLLLNWKIYFGHQPMFIGWSKTEIKNILREQWVVIKIHKRKMKRNNKMYF